jgi:membrane protease YdiL (CAAX protease family)
MSNAIIAIIVVFIIFLIYFNVGSGKMIKSLAQNHSNENAIFFQRYLGFILFGLLPLLFLKAMKISIAFTGVRTGNLRTSLFSILGLGIILVIVNSFAARSNNNLDQYPQIRKQQWNKGLLLHSALSWIIYLAGYEFLFRGFLLTICINEYGIKSAIIINTILYALAHIPKGFKETLGSIPFGIVLCVLTLYTGTLLVPFILHCMLALSNEWFSIKYQPNMSVK